MYDWPEVRAATADLERALQSALSGVLGINDTEFRDRSDEANLVAGWTDPDVLLTQTCGYPLTHALAGKVRLIGAPHYAAPGCRGPNYCSQLVVHRDSSHRTLEDLRGLRAAFNSTDSQSGMNTFRHAVAQLGKGPVFFSDVIESGGHLNSMKMVAAGDAEIASIDTVSWGLACRECPDLAAELRSIGETAPAPGLPLITSLRFSDAEAERIAETVAQVFAAPETAKSRERLGIRGFSKLDVAAYDGILAMERQAAEMGYPVLA